MSTSPTVNDTQPAIGYAYPASITNREGIKKAQVIYQGFDAVTGKHFVNDSRNICYRATRTSKETAPPEFGYNANTDKV